MTSSVVSIDDRPGVNQGSLLSGDLQRFSPRTKLTLRTKQRSSSSSLLQLNAFCLGSKVVHERARALSGRRFVLAALLKTTTLSLISDLFQFCSVFVRNIRKLPAGKNRRTESLVCRAARI